MDLEEIESAVKSLEAKLSGVPIGAPESLELLDEFILFQLREIAEDQGFTVNIRNLVGQFSQLDRQLRDSLLRVCDNEKIDTETRFKAFYALYTISRRQQNNKHIGQLVERYRHDFSDRPLFNVCLSTYYRFKGQDGSKSDFEKAVAYARRAIADPQTRSYEGIRLHFAETVCLAIDQGLSVEEEDLERAELEIDLDISARENYAKCYFVRAKLRTIRKNYSKALDDIATAIELEDKGGKEAFIRIPEYIGFRYEIRQYISANDLDDKIRDLKNRTDALNEELSEGRNKILEYLTFFSGIIAFIVSTVQIALKVTSFLNIVGLLMVMAGLLVVSFSSFLIVTHGLRRKWSAYAVVMGISLLLIAVGVAIGLGIVAKEVV